MSKRLYTFVSLFLLVGIAFVISGVTSPSVVQMCGTNVAPRKMRGPHQPRGPFGGPPPFSQRRGGRSMMDPSAGEDRDDTICLQQGLFFVGVSKGDETMYLVTPLEKRKQQIRVVAGLLLIGGIAILLAELFITSAACQPDRDDKKVDPLTSKRGVVGTVALSLGFVLVLCGLSMYTDLKRKTLTGKRNFASNVISAVSGKNINDDEMFGLDPSLPPNTEPPLPDFIDVTLLNGSDYLFSNSTVNQTDIFDLLTPEVLEIIDESDSQWFPFPPPNSPMHLFMGGGVVPIVGDGIALGPFSGNGAGGNRRRRSAHKAFRGSPNLGGVMKLIMFGEISQLSFGYSFYLCWIGMLFLCIALFLAVYIRVKQSPSIFNLV